MKIAVIMGGISSERPVSLKTGNAILNTLKEMGYDAEEVLINGKKDIFKMPKVDFAFIALHGKFGEDGTVQNYLDLLDIPYTGCGALASANSMDKNITKKILRASGVPTANWTTVKSINESDLNKAYGLNYPVFVKPNSGGSSVATFKVNSKEELLPAVKSALEWDTEVMIEEFVKGYEISCPMLDRKILPVMRIDANGEFFDFESKYTEGGANEYSISLEGDLKEKIEKLLYITWDEMNLEVYSRIDFIITEEGPYLLEINTLPGMTPTSLFPQSAKAYGMDMKVLLQKLIDISLQKNVRLSSLARLNENDISLEAAATNLT